MSILDINLDISGTKLSFQMTFDPNFYSDVGMRQYLLKNGLCEPETVHLFKRVLRPGDYVIDVGANTGFMSIVLSKLVGPKGKVLAVEPGVNNIQKLKDNIAHNKITNITILTQPMWSKNEEVTFHLAHDSGLNSIVDIPNALSAVKLQASTLDEFCKPVPRLVKIDTEGSEPDVLQGLGNVRPAFIVCECHRITLGYAKHTPMYLRETAKDLGYDTFLLHNDGAMPTMLPLSTKIHREPNPPNILFSTLKDVGEVWNTVELK
jgi:FkbM family methyltransferase